MKKNILSGILVFVFTFIALFLALDNKQETYAKPTFEMDSRFTDFNFYTCVRTAIGESGVSSDGVTLKDSALKNLTTLTCIDKKITDTEGLQLMKNLEKLNLGGSNNLTRINVSNNKKLIELELSTAYGDQSNNGNKISSIDLSKNTELEFLGIQGNRLKKIDLQKNTNLKKVILIGNKLTKINLNKNKKIKELYLDMNELSSIDLSNNTKLAILGLASNHFASKPSKCSQLGDDCDFGYVVKFNSNGGSSVQTQNEFYATKPKNPTRNGYRFLGWYKGNSKYTFGKKLTGNIDLVAKWANNNLAQEEEITTNSNNILVKGMIALISIFVAACLGYLTYNILHTKDSKKKNK